MDRHGSRGGRFLVGLLLRCRLVCKLGVSPAQFEEDITREILEAVFRQCCQFLACLVALRVEVIADGEERRYVLVQLMLEALCVVRGPVGVSTSTHRHCRQSRAQPSCDA